jgi:hypothetical protein
MKRLKRLRLTTTAPTSFLEPRGPALVDARPYGELVLGDTRSRVAYLHGQAEAFGGFDIPTFLDGSFEQLDRPVEKQKILLLLPSGEYWCKAEYMEPELGSPCYLITLAGEPSIKKTAEDPDLLQAVIGLIECIDETRGKRATDALLFAKRVVGRYKTASV